MADRSSCSLAIGGTIRSRKALRELVDAIRADGWCIDWDSDPDDWEAHLLACAAAGKPLLLTAHDYAGGGYDSEARPLATSRGLDWRWAWDGCPGAYSGGVAAFRPGITPEPIETGGGDDGGPCIALETLTQWQRENRLVEQIELYQRAFGDLPALGLDLPRERRPATDAPAAVP